MSRPAGYRPVVWLRRLLLVVLVAFLGVVAGLLIKGRGPRAPEPEPPAIARNLGGGADAELRSGKGFSHEVTEDGEPRYQISASSWSSTRDELVRLNDVSILFRRESGAEYTIEAKSGLYQQATATAILQGGVRVRSADGLELEAPGFELTRSGTIVASMEGPVHFRYQDRFAGVAREVSSNLKKKRSELSGAVRIWSLAGEAMDASLTARRLLFEQRDQLLHAEGGVELRRDGEQLNARRLSIELDETGKRPRFVRARWEVTGSRAQLDEGVPQTLGFNANQLSVLFDQATGELLKAELEGSKSAPAGLEVASADGEVRRLETPYLVADFVAGAITGADALGPVTMRDFLAFDPENLLLTGCADSAEARFQRSGELAAIVLDGRVEFNQPTAQVTGATLEAKNRGEIVISGEPARILSRRGDFEAPEILYRPEGATGRASGGVRATLEGGRKIGLMSRGEDTDQPVRVTAKAAEWSTRDGTVTFQDQVRAWQEENFLVANRLEVGSDGKKLTAEGSVKTVIKRAREAGDADADARAPLEVTANRLEFDGEADIVHYTGMPKARQAGRTLSCEELDVELDESSSVESMRCSGNTVLESPADGQTVRGEQALYRTANESVEVTGSPVVLSNADGRKVTGARVLYDLRTGRAQVLTSASETIVAQSDGEPEA